MKDIWKLETITVNDNCIREIYNFRYIYIYIEKFLNLNCSIFYKILTEIIYFILFIYFVMHCIYIFIKIIYLMFFN